MRCALRATRAVQLAAPYDLARQCQGCGRWYLTNTTRRVYCTPLCRSTTASARRRARERGAYVEPVDRGRVFRRDEWVCQLCRRPVLQVLVYPHPMSASLDHVVPLSAGGMHVEGNCQLAHLRCNLVKGARSH